MESPLKVDNIKCKLQEKQEEVGSIYLNFLLLLCCSKRTKNNDFNNSSVYKLYD